MTHPRIRFSAAGVTGEWPNARRAFPGSGCKLLGIHVFVYQLIALFWITPVSLAQDTSRLGGGNGRQHIILTPTTQPVRDITLDLGGWTYRALKSPNPRDGVPWELIATPRELHASWRKGRDAEAAMLDLVPPGKGDIPVRGGALASPIPIVEIPDVLWRQWMASDLQDVVGIHFHEVVTRDLARILYTIHRVPPEESNSNTDVEPSPAPRGCRIEATLLTPLAYCLDQAIAVRKDAKEPDRTRRRGEHELSHAMISQPVFFACMAGPQDWNPASCTGRRSRLEYYWRREKIGRTWKGYRGETGELVTLRTVVVLVPPTRWSLMLPISPERVTNKHVQDFNDIIVRVSQQFIHADTEAQDKFHASHGAYER